MYVKIFSFELNSSKKIIRNKKGKQKSKIRVTQTSYKHDYCAIQIVMFNYRNDKIFNYEIQLIRIQLSVDCY